MIDHLTPYEGVVFGGLIALGLLSMLSADSTTQFVGGVLLCAGFWGGVLTLVRGLLHRRAGSLYVLCLVASLVAGLVKFFVFPEAIFNGSANIIWVFIFGVGIAGLIGTTQNALIRAPKDQPNSQEFADQAKQMREDELPEPAPQSEETQTEAPLS